MRLEAGTQTGLKRRMEGGFDLHGGVVVRAEDRARLEHLCRYLLRPALSTDRLQQLEGGELLLKLKTRRSDGTTHLRLSPGQLLERLAALVPRPRSNLILYHGVLAANAKWRSRIVLGGSTPRPHPVAIDPAPRSRNHDWAELMRRGLEIDSLECPKRCGSRLRFVATIEQPKVIRRILEHLGLPAEPVRLASARGPPINESFDWGA